MLILTLVVFFLSYHLDFADDSTRGSLRFKMRSGENRDLQRKYVFYGTEPSSLAILFPFMEKSINEVLASIRRWSAAGDSCPFIRQNEVSSVDLVFWYNTDLNGTTFVRNFNKRVVRALGDNAECFGQIKFLSALLTPAQDKYPAGPSHQWYNAFLLNTPSLTGEYDFIFWCEHDVIPIRSGFVDKLLHEVTFDNNFFVKGSIHRGNKLEEALLTPATASWLRHINGNALYNFHDPQYLSMIRKVREISADPKNGFLVSMDVSMWMHTVSNYQNNREAFQKHAHQFVYSDFIQSICDDLDGEDLDELLEENPDTYLVHGSSSSVGQKYRANRMQELGSGATYDKVKAVGIRKDLSHLTGKSVDVKIVDPANDVMSERIAVVIPLIESQIVKLKVLFSFMAQPQFAPCSGEMTDIDLVLYISNVWEAAAMRKMKTLLEEYSSSIRCFRQVRLLGAKISKDKDIHTTLDFSGPNLQFMRMFTTREFNERYSYILLMEPDTTPIRSNWLDALIVAVNVKPSSFWIKGTAYSGFREDWLTYQYETSLTSIWSAMNGNAIYNVNDNEFSKYLVKVFEKYPTVPYDVAIHMYGIDKANFVSNKAAFTKIQYTPYIQNYGGTQYDLEKVIKENPDTYLVHSSCRAEFNDKQLYCVICDEKEPWSETCQIKLNSFNPKLSYDRFSTGPTYQGLEISNKNTKAIQEAKIML